MPVLVMGQTFCSIKILIQLRNLYIFYLIIIVIFNYLFILEKFMVRRLDAVSAGDSFSCVYLCGSVAEREASKQKSEATED